MVANFVPKFNTCRVTLTYPISTPRGMSAFSSTAKARTPFLPRFLVESRTIRVRRSARRKATSPGFLENECTLPHK